MKLILRKKKKIRLIWVFQRTEPADLYIYLPTYPLTIHPSTYASIQILRMGWGGVIYYKELAHMNMEAEKAPNLWSTNWRCRRIEIPRTKRADV